MPSNETVPNSPLSRPLSVSPLPAPEPISPSSHAEASTSSTYFSPLSPGYPELTAIYQAIGRLEGKLAILHTDTQDIKRHVTGLRTRVAMLAAAVSCIIALLTRIL